MDALPDFITCGAVVARRTWCGTATARVLSASPRGVMLKHADGVTDCITGVAYVSLADRLTRYRPATAAMKAAAFERCERSVDYLSTRN